VLAALEKELEDAPFLAIGVHSPKFPNERDPEMVRQAVARYGVTHPVVVDSGMEIWREFGVRAWPTFALLDPRGEIIVAGAGEPVPAMLRKVILEALDEGERAGTLDAKPLPLHPQPPARGSLAYPGKVIAGGGRIFVADTGHHQVVELDARGEELRRFDGFHHPNGLALSGGRLYVADTGNHLIRAVELDSGRVETVAGTGEMATGLARRSGPALELALRSPWDLASADGIVYVAMAGSHQIWRLNPGVGEIGPLAGTGEELRRDGPAAEAALAQPSGLAILGRSLYVADSEISSIRAIDDLTGDPVVRTVCGSGELFGFGDRDGLGDEVLLQHPMGIAAGKRGLYVADTFNHRVRRVDPETGECRTVFGNGEPERLAELWPGASLTAASADAPLCDEPEGLAIAGGALLVADTNNHRVLAVRLKDGARRVLLGG
jgi:DNA-binding beta-propeller fold protein YncE